MADKVINGTPKSAPTLCTSCQSGVCVRGINFEEIVYCNELRRDITFVVERCSAFEHKSETSLYDMKKIAWDVTSRKRDRTGFQPTEENPDTMEICVTPPKKREGYSTPDED